MSTMLHAADCRLPDLSAMEQRRELVFLPSGGGDSRSWAYRLAGLGRTEFHLYDRDVSPVTETRREMIAIVNGRPRCRAVLTCLRALGDYLHPDAIFEVSGLRIEFSGGDNVAELVARQFHERHEGHVPWESLPARAEATARQSRFPRWNRARGGGSVRGAVEVVKPESTGSCLENPWGRLRFRRHGGSASSLCLRS